MRDWSAFVREHMPELHLRPEREAEIISELAQQLEDVYREGMAVGLSDEEAFRRASVQFPDWPGLARTIQAAERWQPLESHALRRTPLLHGFLLDVRYSLRQMVRNPGFYALAVITLAFGIGVNNAVFTVADSMAIHPLPYPGPTRLVAIETVKSTEPDIEPWTSPADFKDLVRSAKSFAAVAGISPVWSVVLTGRGEAERLQTLYVSPEFFTILGVTPVLGRSFTPSDNAPGHASDVVMLGHSYWKSRFGGSRDVIGTAVTLDGTRTTIIGVLPPGFEYVGEPVAKTRETIDVWAPLAANPMIDARRSVRLLKVIGRLRDDFAVPRANEEMRALGVALAHQYPDSNRGFEIRVRSLEEQVAAPLRPALFLLLGSVGAVLLIACTNVAGLLLARVAARQREVAVRWALGASAARLVRQLLTEGLVLATVSGIAGVLVGYVALRSLLVISPQAFLRQSIALDGRALLFTCCTVLLSALLCVVPSLWKLFHSEVGEGLRSASRTLTPAHTRIRSVLVTGQISLAVTLLIGAGLLVRSFIVLLDVDTGLTTSNLISIATQVPPATRTPEQRTAFYTKIRETMMHLPSVRDVAAVTRLPLSGQQLGSWLTIEGKPETKVNKPEVEYRGCTPNYFATAGIPVTRGRAFTDLDKKDGVLMINEAAARRFWPNEDPIGKRVSLGQLTADSQWITIVGVVADVRHFGLDVDPRPEVYRPYAANPFFAPVLLIRTADESPATVSALMGSIRSASADSPVYNVYRMRQLVARSLEQRRFMMWLLIAFAAAAALLAALGLYGVVSESVSQRTREIGVRVALGASPAEVARMVVEQAGRLVLIGVTIGCAAAVYLARLITSLLFGIGVFDPLSFASAPLLLAAVALAAAYVPARRASRVDPIIALRQE